MLLYVCFNLIQVEEVKFLLRYYMKWLNYFFVRGDLCPFFIL